MKITKPDIHNNFIIREYSNGDFEGVSHLWAVTKIGNPMRGDDEKTIENSIRLGGSLIVLEEKKPVKSAELPG